MPDHFPSEAIRPPHWAALITIPWDLFLLALAVALLWILSTGGGVYHLAGQRVSIHHVDKLMPAWLLLLWLRWRFTGNCPVGGLGNTTPQQLVLTLHRSLPNAREQLGRQRPLMVLSVLMILALMLRLALAIKHPGFLTGDDVEVHHMSLNRLWDRPDSAWDLRNSFYPLVFIMPAQWLAGNDPGLAVLAGRLVVALYGALSVLLLALAAKRLKTNLAVVFVAAGLLAIAKLTVVYGSSVMPRGVSIAWVLLAFWTLNRNDRRGTVLAALALAVATSLRFSEIIFLVPAVIQLMIERRWRHLIWLGVFWALGCAVILGLSDWLYWGRPFSSLIAIVRYTLIEGSSSRGFQPVWHYLTGLAGWTSLAMVILVVVGWRRERWRPYLWLMAPLILLSCLPHKEARYLLPCVPFLCLGAAYGIDDLLRQATPRRMAWLAPLLLATVVLEVDGYHHDRTDSAVHLARHIAAERGPDDGVLFEWGWRAGGWIYFEDVDNLETPDLLEHAKRDSVVAKISTEGLTWLALWSGTLDRKQLGPDLAERGFKEVEPPDGAAWGGYRLWRLETNTD